MQKHEDNLSARSGGTGLLPLAGATVTVTNKASGLPASLYSDNGVTLITAPIVTDANGYYGFYAADGRYTITYSGATFATFTREIILEDPADNPNVTIAQLSAPTGSALINHEGTPLNVVLASIGAGNYTLPIATASALGGVKVGSGLSIDSVTGVLSANATVSPAMVLLGTATVSTSVANIDFLNVFTSAYDKYVIELENIGTGTTSSLVMQVAVAGAAVANIYSSLLVHAGTTTATTGGNLALGALMASGNPRFTGTITVFDANNATTAKTVHCQAVYMNSASQIQAVDAQAVCATNSALSGFRLTQLQNFTSGTVRVYGIKNT